MSTPNRNDPCPCGSGKKYKRCCLKRDEVLATSKRAGTTSIPTALQVALKHHQAGHLSKAEEIYQQILQVEPNHLDALHFAGVIAHQTGRNDLAIELIGKVLLLKPDAVEAHNNIGPALHEQGRLDEAVDHYRKAISIKPDYADAHSNLGFALQAQGRLDKAVEHYRKALSLKPNLADAHNHLGVALQAQGKLDEAIEHYCKALELNPDYAEAYNNLGNALKDQGRLDEAVASYHRALLFKPDYAEAHNNLGNFREAISIKPDYAEARSNLLYVLNFHAGLSREEIYRAAQEYEAAVGAPLRFSWQAHHNDKDPNRRLRIGYVSPDFRNHAVAYFAEPILSNHDKTQIEVHCYAEVTLEDEVTGRFRRYADHWHSTIGLNDEAVAQMIREHRIDILVDLAGHTAKNRLPTFARKPAPIQITYLGYPGTTGLSAMDYRITDHYADPDGIADAYYSEQLLRLPGSLCCYRPSADMPEVSPLPALVRGHLTFGSFNNFNKIDPPTLELWAELLRTIPTARLMMLTVPDGETRLRLLRSFGDLGINAERLEFHGKLAPTEFHRKFLEVDITLDTVNVSGGTTTCESLWMGVPVMALAGERFITRVSYSFLNTAGLTDFAATSPDGYIRVAAHLADNLPLLAEIRAGLRAHVAASPLIDEVGFTRNLENLYREVWGKWCSAT